MDNQETSLTELKTYCDGVIALAKTLKTNNSNYVYWMYDDIKRGIS